ncbi:MAG: UvrD-helicase domain-containing protein [Acidimicrobiales bacterium]
MTVTTSAVPAPSRELPDRSARQRVVTELDRSLFVEAGAGSGKTTSLVARIVNLVISGVPVTRIAAITFTEAAARELRTRVRDEIDRQGRDRADRHLANTAGQVETAAFTTLHGFALRILSDHPVEAGLPPGFAVADEIGSMLAFDEAWRVFTGQIGDDLSLLDLQERAAVLGVDLRRFADIARRFDDNWDLLDPIERQPAPLSPLELGPVLAPISELDRLVEHCLDPGDKLAQRLIEVAEEARAVADRDPYAELEWLDNVRWPPTNIGRKGNWVRLDVDEVRRRVADLRLSTAAAVEAYRHEVLAHYVARVAGFVEDRVGRRQASGELAFHDLLVLARRLLRSNPRVREQLHQRYSRILLDEFQDTDPIQIELAVLIAADGLVADRPWQELAGELRPGRLTVVGDPKQSIYRFRRADTRVYADAEAALVDEPTRLTANFRSVPGVVDWVNDFFGWAIGAGEPGAQPRYTPLDAVREADPERPVPVVCLGRPHDQPVGEIREIEAADVAAVVCRAVEEEWRVEREGQWRPVRLRDIAVLIPSRLSLPALESAFGVANLPFRPETSSLVYATQEVRDVLAGVRAVVDPANAVDVVAALRSGLFAVGDDDLLSWHLAEGTWNYASAPVPDGLAECAIARAFAVLRDWHDRRWWTDPSALIDQIVRDRRLREAALAEPRPRDRWRRYRFLAEQAREFAATQGGDLHDFVAWVDVQASDMARITEPIPAEPDDDAVRILTIHGSKGLEFPMVVLAGSPTQDANRARGPQVLFPPGAAPEVKLAKGRTTPAFDVHSSLEEVLDRHERVRLHYVAMTRARDLLVVSAHHKEGLQSAGRRTWEGMEEAPGRWTSFERRGDERYDVEPPTQLRLSAGTYAESEAVWREEQRRLLDACAAARTHAATAIAAALEPIHGIEPADDALAAEPAAEREPWRRGRAGTAVGSAVHAVLQAVDLVGDDVDHLARLNAEREGVGELAGEVARLARAALAAPTMARAAAARHWRELYVAAPVGAALVEGFVDLCFETAEGLVVVDYKTDAVVDDADIDRKVARYRPQAAVYAIALEHVAQRPVVECRFVFLGPDGAVERAVPDLDEARAEVVAFLEREVSSRYSGSSIRDLG